MPAPEHVGWVLEPESDAAGQLGVRRFVEQGLFDAQAKAGELADVVDNQVSPAIRRAP
jgi:hypothetical protein